MNLINNFILILERHFMYSIYNGLINTFNIKGRATRREFWYLFVIWSILTIAFNLYLNGKYDNQTSILLSKLFSIITSVPLITAGIRRLHDMNRRAYIFIPFVCFLIFTQLYLITRTYYYLGFVSDVIDPLIFTKNFYLKIIPTLYTFWIWFSFCLRGTFNSNPLRRKTQG